jgi:hypothetical protein
MLQLHHYTLPVVGEPSSEPHPVMVQDSEEWEVEWIFDSEQGYQKLHYLVQWATYRHTRTSWEYFENVENAGELVDEFHQHQHINLQR